MRKTVERINLKSPFYLLIQREFSDLEHNYIVLYEKRSRITNIVRPWCKLLKDITF